MASEDDEAEEGGHQQTAAGVTDVTDLDVSAAFVGDYPETGPKVIYLLIQPDCQAVLAWKSEEAAGWDVVDEEEPTAYIEQAAQRRQERQEAQAQASQRAQAADELWKTTVWRRRAVIVPLIVLDACMWLLCLITNASRHPLPRLPAIESSQVSIMAWINLPSVGVTLSAFCLAVDAWGLFGCMLSFHIVLTLFIIFEIVTTVGISLQGLTLFLLWRAIVIVFSVRLRMVIIQYQILVGTLPQPQPGSSVWVCNHAHSIAREFCALLFGIDRSENSDTRRRANQQSQQTPVVVPPNAHTIVMTRYELPQTAQTWTAPVFLPVSAVQPRRLVPMIMSSPLAAAAADTTPSAARPGRSNASRSNAPGLTPAIGRTRATTSASGTAVTGLSSVSNDGQWSLTGMPFTQGPGFAQGAPYRVSNMGSVSVVHDNPAYASGSSLQGAPPWANTSLASWQGHTNTVGDSGITLMSPLTEVHSEGRLNARTTPQLFLAGTPGTARLQHVPSGRRRIGSVQSAGGATDGALANPTAAAQGATVSRPCTESGSQTLQSVSAAQQRPLAYQAQLLSIVQDVRALQARLVQRAKSKNGGISVSAVSDSVGTSALQSSPGDGDSGAVVSHALADTGISAMANPDRTLLAAVSSTHTDDTTHTLNVVERLTVKLDKLLNLTGDIHAPDVCTPVHIAVSGPTGQAKQTEEGVQMASMVLLKATSSPQGVSSPSARQSSMAGPSTEPQSHAAGLDTESHSARLNTAAAVKEGGGTSRPESERPRRALLEVRNAEGAVGLPSTGTGVSGSAQGAEVASGSSAQWPQSAVSGGVGADRGLRHDQTLAAATAAAQLVLEQLQRKLANQTLAARRD